MCCLLGSDRNIPQAYNPPDAPAISQDSIQNFPPPPPDLGVQFTQPPPGFMPSFPPRKLIYIKNILYILRHS